MISKSESLEVDGVEVPQSEPLPAGGTLALGEDAGCDAPPAEDVSTHGGDQLAFPLDGREGVQADRALGISSLRAGGAGAGH